MTKPTSKPKTAKRACIYELYDPRDGETRYIGKANDAEKRLKRHLRDSRRRNTPVYCWTRKLVAAGVSPAIRVVIESADDWIAAEKYAIAEARANGVRLLNLADGGDEPHCPIEVRRKNATNQNARVAADKDYAFLVYAKRTLMYAKKGGMLSETAKQYMRDTAEAMPQMFGEWANI